jgi:hypothetical protein
MSARRARSADEPSDLILKKDRAPKSGLPDFGNLKVLKSAKADFDARPS